MTTDKIRDKKLQYNINREAVRLYELSTGKVDKQVTLHVQQILSNLSKQNERTSKVYLLSFRKDFRKQTKTIEDLIKIKQIL